MKLTPEELKKAQDYIQKRSADLLRKDHPDGDVQELARSVSAVALKELYLFLAHMNKK